MTKRTTKPVETPRPQIGASPSLKPPIDLEALTPLERTRLDTAVMALVEYLVTASAKAA